MEIGEFQTRIRAAKSGDVDAFAELFEVLRPATTAVAYRLVGPNDADDVVMDTYLKAWKALPRFNERSSLKTWLYRIAHNCAMDYLRARGRRLERIMPQDEVDDRDIGELEDQKASLPSASIEKDEMVTAVRGALAEMDEMHRVVLELRFMDDLSYADIAAAMDVSIGTVMSRLFNAKRKLQRIMREQKQ